MFTINCNLGWKSLGNNPIKYKTWQIGGEPDEQLHNVHGGKAIEEPTRFFIRKAGPI